MALQETLCGLVDSGFWYLMRPAKRSFHKIMTSDSSFYSTMWTSHDSINAEPLMESQPKDMRIEFCRKMRPLLWQQQQQQENPKENFFLMSRQSQASSSKPNLELLKFIQRQESTTGQPGSHPMDVQWSANIYCMNAQLLLPPPSTSRHEIPVLMNVVKRIEKNSSRKKTRRHQQSSKQFSAYGGPQDRGSATESNLNNHNKTQGTPLDDAKHRHERSTERKPEM